MRRSTLLHYIGKHAKKMQLEFLLNFYVIYVKIICWERNVTSLSNEKHASPNVWFIIFRFYPKRLLEKQFLNRNWVFFFYQFSSRSSQESEMKCNLETFLSPKIFFNFHFFSFEKKKSWQLDLFILLFFLSYFFSPKTISELNLKCWNSIWFSYFFFFFFLKWRRLFFVRQRR